MKTFRREQMKDMSTRNFGRDILLGVAVGDALGVPVEFKSRVELEMFPVTEMREYGSHHQPAGTWSDDSSLTFCLAEELLEGYNLYNIGQSFRKWYHQNHWTPHGEVFDIGNTTLDAIERLGIKGMVPELAGGFEEDENGNGSLMRILPIALYVRNLSMDDRYEIIKKVSSLTHGHFRSFTSCFIYIEMAIELLRGKSAPAAHEEMRRNVKGFFKEKGGNPQELRLFDRVLSTSFSKESSKNLRGSGYVLDSLESSIWCLLNSHTYKDAVLQAVNLGEDTDTTGAITGGLAGLLYGYESIPTEWVNHIARKEDIIELADKLDQKFRT